ncbi:20537_t:CDS:2 [Cetraspora pellucida]|uniref:20537_t:CDS:1 n=1 Tax=Cetraspora pellucida TaxID=1433469 RepID=A0A9N9K474_9GLOM|nr:20537_t:CDS:2 [Cetraspora pellucida]
MQNLSEKPRTLPMTNDEIEIPVQCILASNLVADVFNDVLKNNDEKILLSTIILCPKNQLTLDVCNEII